MSDGLAGHLARLPDVRGRDADDALAGAASPGTSFRRQLIDIGLPWRLAALLLAHALATTFLLGSWVLLGRGALEGSLDTAWLTAWALCLASTVPLRVLTRWLEGTVALAFGGLLKQRLLVGAMATDSDQLCDKGTGELLGEALESEAIESLGTSGGMQTALALIELAVVPFMLAWGAAPRWQIALLVAWLLATVWLIFRNTRQRARWTRHRLDLTNQLVEGMSAHRTRLVQQTPAQWHQDEDPYADGYLQASQRLDRSTVRIEAALPRAYVAMAFLVLAQQFVAATATLVELAVTLGAILFAAAALERLSFGFSRVAVALVAWRCVKPMFDAARATVEQDGAHVEPAPATNSNSKVLASHNLSFCHGSDVDAVLQGCSLEVRHGDQILLEGDMGSGKSTLAAVLAGARRPSSGFLLLDGLDLNTLGPTNWRRQVALAPQYHQNHILSAPLAFNLLISRPYPHTAADLDEAQQLSLELGLGGLLERMPGGIQQFVGETGWQLSQGERSRVFLARALLQDARLVILDESFAALDPQTLKQCLQCVMARSATLIVIAHP